MRTATYLKETFFPPPLPPFSPVSDRELLVFFSQHNARHISTKVLVKFQVQEIFKTDIKEGPDGFEALLNIDYVKAMNHSLLRTASKHTTSL